MPCTNICLILDTSVFIFWCDNEVGYGSVGDVIVSEKMIVAMCEGLQEEYLRQLDRLYQGHGYSVYKRKVEQLEEWGAFVWVKPVIQQDLLIHRKDQHVLNCALTQDTNVCMIITDNYEHFQPTAEKLRLPVVITKDDFLDSNHRENACSQGKLVLKEIKIRGIKARLTN